MIPADLLCQMPMTALASPARPVSARLTARRARWWAAGLIAGTLGVTSPGLAQAPQLQPTDTQGKVARLITRQLAVLHYNRTPINDELSARVLQRYLDNLDGQRLYFLAEDIQAFERWRLQLDDQLRAGLLGPAFTIFNRFQQRQRERLQFALAEIERGKDILDFSRDEEILNDRKDEPWARDTRQLDRLWRLRLKAAALSLRLADKSDAEILKTLERRHRAQLKAAEQTRADDAFQVFMNSLAENFDPHTEYYSPRNSENFNINMSLQLEGIGAVLQTEDEHTKIVRLVPGGPADRSRQLKPGDRIIAVAEGRKEFVDVVGWRIDEVVALIRGPKGTQVRLQVLTGTGSDVANAREVVLERNTVALEDQAASKRVIEIARGEQKYRIGVIKLPTFYADFQGMQNGDPNYRSTTRDVRRLVSELRQQDIQGLVLDLRNNGGGSLTEANDLVGEFITSGPTVQVRDARGRVEVLGDGNPAMSYAGPLVVYTNRLSASAAEIFAGAIQDYGRGVVVGGTTFGKGTVQSLRDVGHGQIKLTEAKFYRVSGASTQNRGVEPDISFPELINPEEIGESALRGALPWDTIKAAGYKPLADLSKRLPELQRLSRARQLKDPDFRYVLDQQKLLADLRARKVLSLNEDARRADKDALDQRRLQIENRRRSAKGQPAMKNWAELNAQNEKDLANTDPNFERPEDLAMLQEAAEVAVDLLLSARAARPGAAAAKRPDKAPVAGR